MLNTLIIFTITFLEIYSINIQADSFSDNLDNGEYIDYAKVISSEPVYEVVQSAYPVQECWDEEVEYRRNSESPTSTIAGGIVGGVIGNQFGRGSGKAVMTMAGTLLGATVGRDLGREPGHTVIADERHCETVKRYREEEKLVGYRVTYRYKGKILVTRTEHDPGDTIPIRVAIDPLP